MRVTDAAGCSRRGEALLRPWRPPRASRCPCGGAARAADRSGDAAKAKIYYAKLVELCGRGDSARSEVAEARSRLK